MKRKDVGKKFVWDDMQEKTGPPQDAMLAIQGMMTGLELVGEEGASALKGATGS